MKIALLCTEKLPIPPLAGGAIQLYIEGILPYLSNEHDVTVYSCAHPALPEEEIAGNVRYVRFPAEKKGQYIRHVMKSVSYGYDLIHVFNRPLWVLRIGEALPSQKLSLSLHNEMFLPDKITKQEAAACIRRVEFISTISRFIAGSVEKLYPDAKSKLHTVYSGADTSRFKPVWREEGLLEKTRLKEKYRLKNRKIILYVGRLSVKKGVHILLSAMKEDLRSHPDAVLVIIGSKWFGDNEEDEYTGSLRQLAEEMTGSVLFTGFLPPSEIYTHYCLGDIFVCPSQWNEPLARVQYEAMAAGLPIITTNRGGNAEIVRNQKNGFVIEDYNNPQAFACLIRQLLDHPELAGELGKNGRRLTEETFNWKRVARDVSELFTRSI